ncbi:hypothetical protein F9B16_11440 [Actinomadura montaniterrae]|uniref:Extradiol ring-cleavage dioxygenase class III enzyme subunit B domain-containing protein n=2 Tax=Actinomadura montaniterrae TaxID=1803903 RepID=A0A6L3VWE5_9ACTN|nr:hypothetical protein F9B16_11440 [Actinomadura montaniterrae]
MDPDVIVLHAPHWITMVGHHVNCVPNPLGFSVEPIFPHLLRYRYDFRTDVELAEAIADQAYDDGLVTRKMRNEGVRVDYATITALHLLNPDWDIPVVSSNLADALTGKAPSRVLMMVVANVLALLAVWGDVLSFLGELLGALGIATCSLIALLVTDFKLVRSRTPDRVERVNWAGVIALTVGFGISYWLFWADIFELGFLITLVLTPAVYLGLRRTVLPPGTGTTYVEATAALREIDAEENPVTA